LKNQLFLIFVLIGFAGLLTCNIAPSKKNSIQGAWILVERKQVTEEDTLNYRSYSKSKYMKIIDENHFATVGQFISEGIDGIFSGGFYTLEDGIYKENITYHSVLSMIGVTTHYKVKFEGDLLYLIYCNKHGKVKGISDVWARATVK